MTTINLHNWNIPGSDGQPILGNTHVPANTTTPRGMVVICHGFKGYKDYGFIPQLAQRLAEAGFIALRFNFSHSGMTEKIDTFERPDLFERDTWGKQIADLNIVADAAARGLVPGCERSSALPQIWFGHSRGGVTALLAASRAYADAHSSTNKPLAIITAAAPAGACHLDDQQKQQLREDGRLPSPSGRTGQLLYIGKAWLAEMEASPRDFDPYLAASRLKCPRLIVHGDADDTVPVAAAHAYRDTPEQLGELCIIEQATHTFNAPNPLPTDQPPPPQTSRLFDAVIDFCTRCSVSG